jgi:hypothetical protein
VIVVWQGRGGLAVIALVVSVLSVFMAAGEIFGKDYEGYGLIVGLLVGAAIVWLLDRGRKGKSVKRLTDTEPVEIEESPKDTVFWIPLRYWTIPIVLFAIYGFLSETGVF